MEDVLVVGRDARTPSEQCQCTHEQGTEPTMDHIGSFEKLATCPVVDLAFTNMQLG